MAKQPYHPPEVSELLIARSSLLESLSAGLTDLVEFPNQDYEWEQD